MAKDVVLGQLTSWSTFIRVEGGAVVCSRLLGQEGQEEVGTDVKHSGMGGGGRTDTRHLLQGGGPGHLYICVVGVSGNPSNQ